MHWTTEKPSKPGWYWYRDDDGLRIMTIEQRATVFGHVQLWATGMTTSGSICRQRLEQWNGEWSSELIKEPEAV